MKVVARFAAVAVVAVTFVIGTAVSAFAYLPPGTGATVSGPIATYPLPAYGFDQGAGSLPGGANGGTICNLQVIGGGSAGLGGTEGGQFACSGAVQASTMTAAGGYWPVVVYGPVLPYCGSLDVPQGTTTTSALQNGCPSSGNAWYNFEQDLMLSSNYQRGNPNAPAGGWCPWPVGGTGTGGAPIWMAAQNTSGAWGCVTGSAAAADPGSCGTPDGSAPVVCEVLTSFTVGTPETSSGGTSVVGFYFTGYVNSDQENWSTSYNVPGPLVPSSDEAQVPVVSGGVGAGAVYWCQHAAAYLAGTTPTCESASYSSSIAPPYVGGVTWNVGLSSAATPVPFWYQGMTPPAGEPCQSVSITGPGVGADSYTYDAGQEYSFELEYSGGADQFAVDPEDGASATGPMFGSQQLHTDATVATAENVPVGGAPGYYTSHINMQPTATGQWNPVFYCLSGGQNWTFGGSGGLPPAGSGLSSCGAGQTSSPVGCSIALGQCLSNAGAGLSLTNPATWVGALLDGIGCVLQWAFVPASISGSALVSPITSHAPYTYVADGISAANTLIGGVNGGLAGNGCSAPTIAIPFSSLTHVGNVSSFSISAPAPASQGCSDPGAKYAPTGKSVGDLFGYRTVIRDVLVLAVWVGALVAVWYMFPWAKGDSSVVWVAKGAGLNLDGDYVDTYWTREGSD